MRILGIDLGATSIKAVELDSAFGRYEIQDYHEVKVEPGRSQTETALQLIKSLPKVPDRISVAMKSSQATFRNLQLPTRDKKAIQASIGFELDDDLPFPLEQSVYDYSILSQAGQTTHVHVATTMIKHIEAALAKWQEAGIDPDVITTEAWAYRTLLNRVLSPTAQEEPILLIDVGHQKTTFYVHWRGFPVVAREIDWGGRDLTAAISKKYSIPMEQAEHAKLDHGFVIPKSQKSQATREQVDFSDALLEPIQELIRDLRQIFLTCKSITHQNLGAIYLTGGTSQLHGFARMIEEELSLPVQRIQALSSIAPSGVTYSEHTDNTFLLASSLALSLVKSADKTSVINLRKGSQAKQGRSREFTITSLRRPLLSIAAVAACMFASMIIQSSTIKGQLTETDAQLEKSIRGFFGQLSHSAMKTYMSSLTTLKSSLNKELNKQREIGKLLGPNPHSPLGFLAEISKTIPNDVVVDLIQYQEGAAATTPYSPTENANASLTFLVANPQMAEKLVTVLGSKLSNIQRSKIEEVSAPDGTSKRWKLTLSGKPVEEAYGK